MAHEVESFHYVNNPRLAKTGVPWHGLGEAHDGWMTDAEAKAALDWAVELRPDYWRNDQGFEVESTDSQKVVKLVDGLAVKQLATVGMDYSPFQNADLIDLGSVLVDDYGAKWDTVASLRNDRVVFATLRLDVVTEAGRGLAGVKKLSPDARAAISEAADLYAELYELEDTDYWTWLLLTSSHDTSHALTGAEVKVRTVCANTLASGLGSAKATWKVRHTGDLNDRLEEGRRQLGLVTVAERDFARTAVALAKTEMEVEDFDTFTEKLFPLGDEAQHIANANALAARSSVKSNWLQSDTIAEPVRHTRWGAFNAVTEWAEWTRPVRNDKTRTTSESRMLSTCYGGPVSKVREQAATLLRRGL